MSAHSTANRQRRAVESFRTCAEALAPVERGMSAFVVTRGQWSMIDAILVVLDSTPAPHDISLWTWTIADYEVKTLARLMRDGRLRNARLIIDKGAQSKNGAIIRDWIARFGPGSVSLAVNHAKIARISDADGGRYLLRGSMNLNANPRFEQLDISEGCPAFDLVEKIEAEFPTVPLGSTNAEILAASKVNKAWDQEQLQLFGGFKTWAK